MKNPLNSVGLTHHARRGARDRRDGRSSQAPTTTTCGLARWLHILSGVFWIGLLYYFNVVQIPAPGRRGRRQGRPRRRGHHQVRRAARAALVPLGRAGHLAHRRLAPRPALACRAFTLARKAATVTIGIGVWLGTIMLFNVWVLIWPNQKKVLGIVPATDEEKAKARRIADARLAHQLRAVVPDAGCAWRGQSHGAAVLRIGYPEASSGAAGGPRRTGRPGPGGRRRPRRRHRRAGPGRRAAGPRHACSRASGHASAARPGSTRTFRQLDPAIRHRLAGRRRRRGRRRRGALRGPRARRAPC